MQHHDAVTGTERIFVGYDYIENLDRALDEV